MEVAAEAIGLTKRYGKTLALDKLNLKVRNGEILVLLGPNGSGKTTFLHTLSTVLKPTSGTARVMGYDIVKQPLKVRETIGISFQEPRGFWRHKPRHILSFHAAIYGVDGGNRDRIVEETLKEFELWDSKDKRFMQLSGGQSKRLEVAKLFIHKPKVAIFDEPTSMVDLAGKRMIWDKIRQLREDGSTIIIATNEVREAEYLADRITILNEGREIITESLMSLKDSIKGGDVVDIEFVTPIQSQVIETLQRTAGTEGVLREADNRLRVHVTKSEDWLPVMMSKIQSQSVKISSVRVTEPSLDDVFLHYTGTALRSEKNA